MIAVDAGRVTAPPAPRGEATLHRTGRLVRFALRRQRVRLAIWSLGIVGLVLASAASLPPVYPDQASMDSYAALMGDNPALIAFAGPGHGLDEPTIGAILVNEVQLFGAIAFALMSIFLVNQLTRAEEDVERLELLRSTVIGRHAPTAAAVAVVGGATLAVSTANAIGCILLGYDATGSVALAASMGAVGLVFIGVTVVMAQVTSSGRATLGSSSAVLAAAFVLRALGDIADNWLRWTSPIGWAQGVQAFADEQWWTLVLCLVAAGALVLGGFRLANHRDLGSGLVATRPGSATAGPLLTTPLGLAARLHRGSLIGWSIGLLLAGMLYGSIGEDVEQMIEDNPVYADFLATASGASVTDAFFASSLMMLGLIVSGFAIAATLRLRTEETTGRAEPLLASAVSRTRWALSHLTVALVGSVVLMGLGGLGLGVSFALVSGEGDQVLRLTAAAMGTLPAIVVLVGVTTAVYGLVPRFALAAWGVFAAVAVVALLAEVLRLPAWTRNVSPFQHLAQVPAVAFRPAPALVLLAIGVALIVAGLAGLRTRDLAST